MSETSESLLIPSEFYFQTTFEIPFQEDLESDILSGNHPKISVPLPHLLFESADAKRLGTVHVAWNDAGMAITAETILPQPEKPQLPLKKGKRPQTQVTRPDLDFYIDTRDMKSNKRANRFCHHFELIFPAIQGEKNLPEKIRRVALSHSQSRNLPSSIDEIPISGSIEGEKIRASCWLSKDVLTGFDPENVPSIGFFYLIRSHDLQGNSQPYGLSENFPYMSDPSLWPSLKLSR